MAGGQKVGDAYVDIDARFDKLNRSVNNVERRLDRSFSGMTKNLGRQFVQLGGVFAGAFAVDRIRAFIQEAVRLAGVAEGVQKAFDRIADPSLMKEMQEATRGTVSELELMKTVTSASALGLNVSKLPELLEFARRRAKDTGQEVDYLVNSIVTGIGRKSPLILDNLGISAVELKEKLGGVGLESASIAQITEVVGAIASKAYDGFEEGASTSQERAQQLNAELENTTLEVGQKLTPAFNEMRQAAVGALSAANIALDKNVDGVTKLKMFFAGAFGGAKMMSDAIADAALQLDEANKKTDALNRTQEALNVLREKQIITDEMALISGGKLTDQQHFMLQNYHDLILQIQKEKKEKQENTEATEELTEAAIKYAEALKKIKENLESINYWTLQNAMVGRDMANAFAQVEIDTTEAEKLGEELESLFGEDISLDHMQLSPEQLKAYEEAKTKMGELGEQAHGLESAISQMASGLVNSLGKGEDGFNNFIKGMGNMILSLISRALAGSLANAILTGTNLGAASGPAGVVTGPAAIASGTAGVAAAFKAIPMFAKGGQSMGGAAIVGERGPELVTLAKGSMVTPNHMMSSALGYGGRKNQMIPVTVTGLIKGDNIFLSNSRGKRNRTR